MNPRLQKVRDLPLHQHLGIGQIESSQGRGTFTVTVSDPILNPAGVLHGGVVYILSDVCAYAGLLSILDDQLEAVTHDIHVSVLAFAPKDATLTFTSEIVKMGKRLCFIDVTARTEKAVVATARVTKSLIPAI